MNKERKSKVAICEKCNCFVKAAHLDHISEDSEKDFTYFTNQGFTVKIETIEETQQRVFRNYHSCCLKQNDG